LEANNAGIRGPALTSGDYAEADWRKVTDLIRLTELVYG